MSRAYGDTTWCEDHEEVLNFARILDEAGRFGSVSDVLYYFEKPYKWTADYELWQRMGEPTSDNPKAWDDFTAALVIGDRKSA